MQRRSSYFISLFLLSACFIFVEGCKKKDYAIPTTSSNLQNDLIKRSLGRNIVGKQIEFAYAIAILPTQGKLFSATVEASIAGGTGTYLENNSYYTNGICVDVPVSIGQPSVTT